MNNDTTWFSIDPVDALFFRDGTPFTRGENHAGNGYLFPPAPSTVVGTIRYSLAKKNGWTSGTSWVDRVDGDGTKLQDVLGDGPHNLGKLSFVGPILCDDQQAYFPMPRCVIGHTKVVRDDRLERKFEPETWMVPGEIIESDLGRIRLPMSPVKTAEGEKAPDIAEDFYVSQAGLAKIKQGLRPDTSDCLHIEKFYKAEPRVGIARNLKTRTVQPRMLYNPRFLRLEKKVKLVMGVNGIPNSWMPSMESDQIIPFGGEARMARLSTTKWGNDNLTSVPDLSKSSYAIVSLLTPALLGDSNDNDRAQKWWGAKPGDEAASLHPEFKGEVICASVGRPIRIGGWNTVARAPENMIPYAPAGSTWWLNVESCIDLTSGLIQLGKRTECGFGLAVVLAGPGTK